MNCSLLGTRLDARSNTTFASQPTWCTSINANQYNCSLFYTQHPTTEGLRLCEPATSGNSCNAGDEFFCSPPPSPPTAPPPPSFPPATCDGRAGRSNLRDLDESPFAVLKWCNGVNANSNDCTLLYTGTPQGVTRLCYPDADGDNKCQEGDALDCPESPPPLRWRNGPKRQTRRETA